MTVLWWANRQTGSLGLSCLGLPESRGLKFSEVPLFLPLTREPFICVSIKQDKWLPPNTRIWARRPTTS